jgi:hypothetical protein
MLLSNMRSQCLIKQGLVIPSARLMNLLPKLFQNIVINPNGNGRLPRTDRIGSTPFPLTEIVFYFCTVVFCLYRTDQPNTNGRRATPVIEGATPF